MRRASLGAFRSACVPVACCVAVLASAPALALELGKTADFDIPAQPLSSALVEFGRQTGVQVMTAATDVGSLQTPGVHGELSLRAALEQLLKGTGLQFQEAGPNSLAVGRFAGSSAAIPAVAPAAAGPEALVVEASQGTAATQIAEVVVTATKREKSVRSIPESITSISGAELEQRNAQGADDIVKLVPGVNLQKADGQPPRITVNGISSQQFTGFTAGVLFGDVSFTDQYIPFVALDPQPFDLKSVEVLKGPQGTLFGASALNGAIRYVPNDARFDRWEFKYFAQGANYSGSAFKPSYGGVVNVPIADSLAFRLTGFERETPGYMSVAALGIKDSNTINQGGLRGMLRWAPTDPLDVKLTWMWQNTHVADGNTTGTADGELVSTDRKRLSPLFTAYSLADLNVSYDLGWARLVSDSADVRKQMREFGDGSYTLPGDLPIISVIDASATNTWSQELRLVSPGGPQSDWQWVGGLFLSQQTIGDTLEIPLGNSAIPTSTILPIVTSILPSLAPLVSSDGQIELIRTATNVTIREEALFGDLTRRFWQNLELTLGGRLYAIDSGGINVLSGALIEAFKLMPQYDDPADIREKGFNPHASLLWHVTPDIITYVAAAKGFRPGGVQSGAPFLPSDNVPAVFHSDTIWDYESGLRTQWFHKTLQVDVGGFYERWKNPQYSQQNSSGLLAYITNAGGVKSLGGNLALQWLTPIKGLSLNANGGYVRAVTTQPYNFSNSVAPVGTPWPFAPHWQTATTLAYNVDVGETSLRGQLTHTYISKAKNDLVQQLDVFGYQQLDVNADISDRRVKWLPDLSLTVNNVTDTRAYTNHKIVNGLGDNQYEYVLPRALLLRLSGHF